MSALSEYELGILLSTMSPGSAAMTIGRSQAWVEQKREQLKNGSGDEHPAAKAPEGASVTPDLPSPPAAGSSRPTRPSTRRADPEELRRLYVDENMSCKAISEKLGTISDNGVRKALERAGVPIKTKAEAQPSRVDPALVIERLAAGEIAAEVAALLSISVETVWRIRREANAKAAESPETGVVDPPSPKVAALGVGAVARLDGVVLGKLESIEFRALDPEQIDLEETIAAAPPLHVPTVFDPAERRPAQATGDWADAWERAGKKPPAIAVGEIEEVTAIYVNDERVWPESLPPNEEVLRNCRCAIVVAPSEVDAEIADLVRTRPRLLRFARWFSAARWRLKDIAALFDIEERLLREALRRG